MCVIRNIDHDLPFIFGQEKIISEKMLIQSSPVYRREANTPGEIIGDNKSNACRVLQIT